MILLYCVLALLSQPSQSTKVDWEKVCPAKHWQTYTWLNESEILVGDGHPSMRSVLKGFKIVNVKTNKSRSDFPLQTRFQELLKRSEYDWGGDIRYMIHKVQQRMMYIVIATREKYPTFNVLRWDMKHSKVLELPTLVHYGLGIGVPKDVDRFFALEIPQYNGQRYDTILEYSLDKNPPSVKKIRSPIPLDTKNSRGLLLGADKTGSLIVLFIEPNQESTTLTVFTIAMNAGTLDIHPYTLLLKSLKPYYYYYELSHDGSQILFRTIVLSADEEITNVYLFDTKCKHINRLMSFKSTGDFEPEPYAFNWTLDDKYISFIHEGYLYKKRASFK